MTHKGEAYVLVYGSDEVVFEMMKKEQNLRAYGDYKEIIPRSSPSPTTARDLLRYTGEMILDVGDKPTTAQTLTMFIFGRFSFTEEQIAEIARDVSHVNSARNELKKLERIYSDFVNQIVEE